MVENPNVRSFVLECWSRLSVRTSLQYANSFLTAAVDAVWSDNSKAWAPEVCRYLALLQTPFVITTDGKADIVIEGVPLKVPRRDKAALLLLLLFKEKGAGKTAWGESRPSAGETPFDDVIASHRQMYAPQVCWVHHGVCQAMAQRRKEASG